MLCALACLLAVFPISARAQSDPGAWEALLWTEDGYRLYAGNAAEEVLMISDAREMIDGFAQNVGVRFTVIGRYGNEMPASTAGGNGTDGLAHAAAATDGWIAVGATSSSDLGTTWHEGTYDDKEPKTDGWVVRVDLDAQVRWMRTYGGSDWDSFAAVCPAHDGGWIVAGNTYSSDGDVTGRHDSGELFAQPDGWVLHLDDDGSIRWARTYGGSGHDELFSIRQVPGGYIAVGETDSGDGDVQGNLGGRDGWVLLLSPDGDILHQACLGGPSDDTLNALAIGPAGMLLAAGSTWRPDVLGTEQVAHGWAVSLDVDAQPLWSLTFGLAGVERSHAVVWNDTFWAIAGYTYADEGMKEWIVSIPPEGGDWALIRGDM